MLEALITSKTRLKMLLKFFLNSNAESYMRSLESEFKCSSNAIRVELNNFEKAGLLNSSLKGNKKYYKANTNHPLFPEIHNIILKHIGIDKIIEEVIEKVGEVAKVFLTGDFVKGQDSKIIDLILVGGKINMENLVALIDKAEKLVKRKIRYMVFTEDDFKEYHTKNNDKDMLLLWSN